MAKYLIHKTRIRRTTNRWAKDLHLFCLLKQLWLCSFEFHITVCFDSLNKWHTLQDILAELWPRHNFSFGKSDDWKWNLIDILNVCECKAIVTVTCWTRIHITVCFGFIFAVHFTSSSLHLKDDMEAIIKRKQLHTFCMELEGSFVNYCNDYMLYFNSSLPPPLACISFINTLQPGATSGSQIWCEMIELCVISQPGLVYHSGLPHIIFVKSVKTNAACMLYSFRACPVFTNTLGEGMISTSTE